MDNNLEVHNPSYEELFSFYGQGYKLTIPPYQRPYVWDEKKVLQLLDDWKDFEENISSESCQRYYMGALIIHVDNNRHLLNIVDGQQRLTTIMLIDFIMNKEDSALKKYQNLIDFTFSSHISRTNIVLNSKFVKEELKNKYNTCIKNIFEHLKFSVVMTDNEDDAFTFFDSQNNRGIQPAAVDVMKAVHLRAIQNDDALRKKCAEKWQEIQLISHNIFRNSPEEYLDNLVDMALWRIRRWKGNSFENDSSYDTAMDEFAEHPKKGNGNIVKLYAAQSICKIKFETGLDNHILMPDNESDKVDKLFQFDIRQPLYKGVSVFTYIETYHEIAKLLFIYKSDAKEINDMRNLFEKLYLNTNSSKYMSDYFIIMMIAYYDKFGSKHIFQFAKMIDYVIGMNRLNKFYFKSISMRNFMQDYNILDRLQTCFDPDDVIEYMASLELKDNSNPPDNGPIKNYISACKSYYKKEYDGDIRDVKLKWAKNE